MKRDLVWNMARTCLEKSHIPAWGGFNALVSETAAPLTRVRYLPFINALPSDYSTIYTTLVKLVHLATELRQGHILVTADLAIYSKVQQIVWAKPEPLAGRVTMRLGVMHLTMAFIGSIEKLFGDGGLI